MADLAEVVTLYKSNSREIPDMLRQMADSVQSEDAEQHDMTEGIVAVQVKESGEIEIYGWGKFDQRFETVGVLQAAIVKLLS